MKIEIFQFGILTFIFDLLDVIPVLILQRLNLTTEFGDDKLICKQKQMKPPMSLFAIR